MTRLVVPAPRTPPSSGRRGLAFAASLLIGCGGPDPAAVAVPGVPMDGHPGRRTRTAGWDVRVAEGGALSVDGVPIDTEVDPRVAVSGARLVYARRTAFEETDLYSVDLPDGTPEPLTSLPGSEDRPVLSPDGRRVAFVSGTTGIAAWWVVDAAGVRQLSNIGVEARPRRPGHPPEGFVPVPDGTVYSWTEAGLSWVAQGKAHALEVGP